MIDTHTHIYLKEFDLDRTAMIQRAQEAGVQLMILPNVDASSVEPLATTLQEYPHLTRGAMGLHPTSVQGDFKKELDTILSHLDQNTIDPVAVGEIGIDLYWEQTYLEEQIIAFETQLEWAIQHDLPVIIHQREALGPVISSIKRMGAGKLHGIFHSFTGGIEEYQHIASLREFAIGINGIVTFKNAALRTVIPQIPIEQIVIETDAPYLAPVPHRGKRNEPAFLLQTRETIATLQQIPMEKCAKQLDQNARKYLRLPTT